jgi:hypothetical protein
MSRLFRLNRLARGAGIALVLALVAAAPAAAAQPVRTKTSDSTRVSHFPAGTGCTFDVTVYRARDRWFTETDFSDGRIAFEVHSMQRTIVNDATGAEYTNNIVFHEIDNIDGSGIDHGAASGEFVWQFYPGDVYLDGTVLDHLVALDMIGRATYTVDWNTGQTLQISFVGQYTDICAAIS